jgi:large subunit ribosomal protein L35
MKIKTNRSAAKRFRATGGGKLKRGKAFHRHLLSSKNRKQKRHLGKSAIVDSANMAGLKRILPYL